jgi:hypothetical protein
MFHMESTKVPAKSMEYLVSRPILVESEPVEAYRALKNYLPCKLCLNPPELQPISVVPTPVVQGVRGGEPCIFSSDTPKLQWRNPTGLYRLLTH